MSNFSFRCLRSSANHVETWHSVISIPFIILIDVIKGLYSFRSFRIAISSATLSESSSSDRIVSGRG